MPLSFPLPLASFLDLMPVAGVDFELGEAVQADETGGGEQLTAALGARLWQGRVHLGAMTWAEAADAAALADLVRAPGRPFLVTDARKVGPAADPAGAALAGFAPALEGVHASQRDIKLSGLPPFYQLRRGDLLAFDYGGGARRALHRMVTGVTAWSTGFTDWFEVVPEIRAGLDWPTIPVALLRPACKAVVRPGTFEPGESRRGLTEGMSFGWIQTLG